MRRSSQVRRRVRASPGPAGRPTVRTWSAVPSTPRIERAGEPAGVPARRARRCEAAKCAPRCFVRGDAGAAADRAVRLRARRPTSPSTATTSAPVASILLHDPAGNDAWDGTFRCVAYARAEIDLEMVTDPLLADVGWTLADRGARRARRRRTPRPRARVTRVATESFGAMADEPGTAQLEIRASWTPSARRPAGIEPHVEAWGELLCTAVGLPPVPEGVTAMPSRRGQRGAGPDDESRLRAACAHRTEDPAASGDRPRRRPRHRAQTPEAPPAPLLTLRDGLPAVTDTPPALVDACRALAAGTGPVAHRRRAGVRLPLLPAGLPDPAAPRGLRHASWSTRSASTTSTRSRRRSPTPSGSCTPPPRTSPACAEVGLVPSALFDTELAARLLGYPRVGLATLVETLLGYCDEQGALRRRLVDATAARSRGWSTPPSTSRSSSSCATCWPPSSSSRGQGRVGPPGVRRTSAASPRPSASTRGGVPPGCTRCADAVLLGGGPRALGGARRARPGARRRLRAG